MAAPYRSSNKYRSSFTYRGQPARPAQPGEQEVPGVIDAGGQAGQVSGSDEPGVLLVDMTDFHRHPAESANPSVGNKQARIVTSKARRDPSADGENRWFRGQLVRRRGGRWR